MINETARFNHDLGDVVAGFLASVKHESKLPNPITKGAICVGAPSVKKTVKKIYINFRYFVIYFI